MDCDGPLNISHGFHFCFENKTNNLLRILMCSIFSKPERIFLQLFGHFLGHWPLQICLALEKISSKKHWGSKQQWGKKLATHACMSSQKQKMDWTQKGGSSDHIHEYILLAILFYMYNYHSRKLIIYLLYPACRQADVQRHEG